MVEFAATLQQFAQQGEKTGWTYILVPQKIAEQLKPGHKKSFRVKGKVDNHSLQSVALLPMGDGHFIIPFNAAMRKSTGKKKGAVVQLKLQADDKPLTLHPELMACLADEPTALKFFTSLTPSVQHYYSKWIASAKTEPTRTKRIALAVSSLAKKMGFPEMMREQKKDKDMLNG